jgi:hypothetical protein
MSLRRKYLKILSRITPAGAAGFSMLLGSAAPVVASQDPADIQPQAIPEARISLRLAAIRDAASDVARQEADAQHQGVNKLRLAWGNWWRNGGWGWRPWRGWGWPNWNNWHNWHNWHNWPNWWRNW